MISLCLKQRIKLTTDYVSITTAPLLRTSFILKHW